MRSKNLQLRALEPSDVDLLFKWENDTSVWHLSSTLTPFSRFTLEQYVMNAGEDIYANKQLRLMIDIIDDHHPRTIGCIDLFDFDPSHMRAGIGIMIIDSERKKGYASEALDLMIDYAFNRLNLHQLYSNVLQINTASLELFKRKHFELIGVKKDWIKLNNNWQDEYILQLINQNSAD
ncbi:MAG: GNAT family protein [Bacteroidota bacterium]